MTRNVRIATGFVAALVILGAGSMILDRHSTVSAATVMAPRFEVDPMWPKPLPESLGDRHDHRRFGRCQ